MQKILVTGVTGFIGSHLVRELVGSHDVYGAVRPCASRDMAALRPFLQGASLVRLDITDPHAVAGCLRSVDPDVVVHLAALSPVRDSFDAPLAYVRTNIDGTLHIAHELLRLPDPGRRRLIYASTAEVYGIQQGRRVREDAALNPSSPYAATKAMTDNYLRMMAAVYGLDTTVLRCINSYGRKLDASFFVEYVVTTMLRGETVHVGAPGSTRDYMYVSDHVGAILAALRHPEVRGEAFNATPGGAISNEELALKIADILGFPRDRLVLGHYPPHYPLRPRASEQPHIDLDSSKIRSLLGWRPTVTLADGLARTVAYWEERLRSAPRDRAVARP